jgi:hypothetical protein
MFKRVNPHDRITLTDGATHAPAATLEDGVERLHIWEEGGRYRLGQEAEVSGALVVTPTTYICLEALFVMLGLANLQQKKNAPPADTTVVRYIGRRPVYKDGIYGTGIWEQDQERDIPVNIARKMAEHRDQYELMAGEVMAIPEAAPSKGDKEKQEKENDLQTVKEQVARMDKAQLKDFAFTNFSGYKLHPSLTEANARTRVINLIDQFGTP